MTYAICMAEMPVIFISKCLVSTLIHVAACMVGRMKIHLFLITLLVQSSAFANFEEVQNIFAQEDSLDLRRLSNSAWYGECFKVTEPSTTFHGAFALIYKNTHYYGAVVTQDTNSNGPFNHGSFTAIFNSLAFSPIQNYSVRTSNGGVAYISEEMNCYFDRFDSLD